jgi:hypothetical protein
VNMSVQAFKYSLFDLIVCLTYEGNPEYEFNPVKIQEIDPNPLRVVPIMT